MPFSDDTSEWLSGHKDGRADKKPADATAVEEAVRAELRATEKAAKTYLADAKANKAEARQTDAAEEIEVTAPARAPEEGDVAERQVTAAASRQILEFAKSAPPPH